jgi:rSAM/selenodomain-associated transferase 2
MRHAFQQTFAFGAGSVLIVGTDIPDLTDSIVNRAFGMLTPADGTASARRDMVLGPTRDGGYYLIGFSDRVRQGQIDAVLTDIPWSSAAVLERTERLARTAGLSYALLDVLDDVDRPRDLPVWHRAQRRKRKAPSATTVSVIIPALNEEGTIAGTIDSARDAGPGTEIIVVDGGSTDRTAAVARAAGAMVISSPPPRSHQMNVGAGTARGDLLLFVHADTALPVGYDGHIFDLLDRTGAVAGAFMLGIDGKGFGLRAVEWMANMRSRLFQMPYGDQGLFIRADLFYKTGGFPEIPIMDDFEMIRRLRKRGAVAVAPVSVTTSARRWRNFGVVKTTLINQIIIIAYLLGIPPGLIARWYRRKKGIGQ